MGANTEVEFGRGYDHPDPQDERRILVDRLMARGISNDDLRIDRWLAALAPSTDLRNWYDHRPERFEQFCDRYEQELTTDDPANEALNQLADEAQKNRVMIMPINRDASLSRLNLLAFVLAARVGV